LQRDALTRAQAMCADAVVLTKLDLADAASIETLAAEIARLNPYAGILRGSDPAIAAGLWDAAALAPAREVRHFHGRVEDARADDVGVLTVRFDRAVELSGFCVRLAGFLEHHASRVLRVKGLVRVQGRRGPAVIQAVGPTLYPVRTLKAWPAGVRESALVVVARDMPNDELRLLQEEKWPA
jgi:G3E family GTPase